MKDARCEQNHVNLVFLSNELQPLQLGPDDRRYMVLRTPAKREKLFYKAVVDEIRAGGAAAFHQYLLEIDLEGFDEATEPIETQAKRDLIEIGMNAAQLFWRDIHDDEIGLPYCPALVQDVYRAYLTWCKRNGEKMPMRVNRFVPAFMTLNGVRRIDRRLPAMRCQQGVWYASEKKSMQRRVLIMGEAPEGADPGAWLCESVLNFANTAEQYCRGEREFST
jgi:hypothetical protein